MPPAATSEPSGVDRARQLIVDGEYGAALDIVRRLLAWDDSQSEHHYLAGLAITRLHDYRLGEIHHRRACALAPQSPRAWEALGFNLGLQGRLDEAESAYETMRLFSDDPASVDFMVGMCRIRRGDLESGWPLYQRRLDRPGNPLRDLAPLWWQGTPLKGKKLVVMCEQGFGDVIQFARFLPDLARMDGEILFSCYPALMDLLRPLVPGEMLVSSAPPTGNHFTTVVSLYSFFGRGEVRNRPYLAADPQRVARIGHALGAGTEMKIGVAWCGSAQHPQNFARSCQPEAFGPLARLPGVKLYALSPDPSRPMLPECRSIFAEDLAPLMTDFAETAAVLENMDLVIAVDTGIAHLAGALGRPTWLMLHASPEWRWAIGDCARHWYASMRPWRQAIPGEWSPVVHAMAQEIAHTLQQS